MLIANEPTQNEIDSIADSLAAAKHEPNHPSYKAFADETIAQFRDILAEGVRLEFVSGTSVGSSAELFRRLDTSNELPVSLDGAPFAENHPLAEYLPEFGCTLNVLFRAVHDYNGHYLTRSPFETFAGELTAYRNHARMYSTAAQSALFGETVAQLCWYYSRDSFVPVQKCAILPVIEL